MQYHGMHNATGIWHFSTHPGTCKHMYMSRKSNSIRSFSLLSTNLVVGQWLSAHSLSHSLSLYVSTMFDSGNLLFNTRLRSYGYSNKWTTGVSHARWVPTRCVPLSPDSAQSCRITENNLNKVVRWRDPSKPLRQTQMQPCFSWDFIRGDWNFTWMPVKSNRDETSTWQAHFLLGAGVSLSSSSSIQKSLFMCPNFWRIFFARYNVHTMYTMFNNTMFNNILAQQYPCMGSGGVDKNRSNKGSLHKTDTDTPLEPVWNQCAVIQVIQVSWQLAAFKSILG